MNNPGSWEPDGREGRGDSAIHHISYYNPLSGTRSMYNAANLHKQIQIHPFLLHNLLHLTTAPLVPCCFFEL